MPMFDMLVQSPAGLGESLGAMRGRRISGGGLEETQEEDDANNILYRFEASFDYDVSGELEKIKAPLLAILFGDDELNPVELGVIQQVMTRVRGGRFVIVPPGPTTEGHRTQVRAAVWKDALATFLAALPPVTN